MVVVNLTVFRRTGISDWVLQRASSVVMLAYSLTLVSVIVPNTNYEAWSAFMAQTWMRGFSSFTLFSMIAHAWIGFWGVMTDYVTERMLGHRGDSLRFGFLLLMATLLLGYFLWGILIIWEL